MKLLFILRTNKNVRVNNGAPIEWQMLLRRLGQPVSLLTSLLNDPSRVSRTAGDKPCLATPLSGKERRPGSVHGSLAKIKGKLLP